MANFIPYTTRINVLFEGRAVDEESLETPLFVAVHNIFSDRQKIYSSTAEMITDGFAQGSPAVTFAAKAFSGRRRPATVVIGRQAPATYTIQVNPNAATDSVVSVNVTVAGVASTVSYTVGSGDTMQDIGNGLATALSATAAISSATSSSGGLVTVVPAGTATFSLGTNQLTTIYTTSSETATVVMAAIQAEFDNFFFISSELHDAATQQELASIAEQGDMLYIYSSNDVTNLDATAENSIMFILKGLQYQYTMGMYDPRADKDFPEGAAIGAMASQDPSLPNTLNLQSLAGVTPVRLNTGQKTGLVTNNGNYYELERGVGTFKEGFTANGDFIDRSRFGLWLKLRGQLALFNRLKRAGDRGSAIVYSDADVATLRAALYNDVINVGLANGSILSGITTNPVTGDTINLNPVVSTGTRAQQTNNNIGQRLWAGFIVEVVYAGAIHHLDATAYVINNREPQ